MGVITRRLEVWMNIIHPTSYAKLRPGDLVGPMAQNQPVFFFGAQTKGAELIPSPGRTITLYFALADLCVVLER